MIADVPFGTIEKTHLEELVANGVREGKRLDFKQGLSLVTREEKVEFLRDVIALANSDGGIIVCGVREGEGEEKGVAVAVDGIVGNFDEISNKIDSLLRDCVDERLRVDHRPVTLGEGKEAYLIRVPASPLAPHMIANILTSSPRFFSRANTSNEPMTARQIKEASLRHGAAVERAADRIRERVDVLKARASRRVQPVSGGRVLQQDQSILHVVPLFPNEGGWNYSDPAVAARLVKVPAFGNWESRFPELRFTQFGAFNEYDERSHTGFLRNGALEGQEYEILTRSEGTNTMFCIGSELADSIDQALVATCELSRDGLMPAPVLVQLHLTGVQKASLQSTRRARIARGPLDEADVATDAFVLTEWSEKDRVLRNLLDHVWQAWGNSACDLFDVDGKRMLFDRFGHRTAQAN